MSAQEVRMVDTVEAPAGSEGPTRQVFQLHPNGWHFAAGHVAKLELLGADSDPAGLGGFTVLRWVR